MTDVRQRPKPQGLGEFLAGELRYAIQDIRQKVVEQGWFGRRVTPAATLDVGDIRAEERMPPAAGDSRDARQPTFGELCAHERSTQRPFSEHDRGIDL